MAETKLVKKNLKEETLLTINSRVGELQENHAIDLPKDYSVGNALQAAWFIINDVKAGKKHDYAKAVDVCTQKSISEAIFQMVTEGTNPVKKQCYFIVYDDPKTGEANLTYMRSYQGTIALAKRLSGIKDVVAREVYKDDEYLTEIGEDGIKKLVHHKQTMQSMDGEIVGGYCIVTDKNGVKHLTEMSMKKIRTSWGQGKMNGAGDTHKNFTDEMVKRTLINRACKPYVNATDDSELLKYSEDNQRKVSTDIPSRKIEASKQNKPKQIEAQEAEVVQETDTKQPEKKPDWRGNES